MAAITKQQFSSALAHLDESHDSNREQDLKVQALRVRFEGASRRQLEALKAGDVERVGIEATYLSALIEELRILEDSDVSRHAADHQIYWQIRPFIAIKETANVAS